MATKKSSLTYTFVFEEMQTLLSSAMPALPAPVPGVMGADLHPTVQGTQRALCVEHVITQQPWNNRAFMENTGGFLLHANYFTVFHQKITFLRIPTVARTDPL